MLVHIYESSADRQTYLVRDAVLPYFGSNAKKVFLHLTMSSIGSLFFWPDPVDSGGAAGWAKTRQQAVALARRGFVRLESNIGEGAYAVFKATSTPPPPKWPKESMPELLKLCFDDYHIKDAEHPIVVALTRGPQG